MAAPVTASTRNCRHFRYETSENLQYGSDTPLKEIGQHNICRTQKKKPYEGNSG